MQYFKNYKITSFNLDKVRSLVKRIELLNIFIYFQATEAVANKKNLKLLCKLGGPLR